jgi:hypothetical protein
MEARTSAFCASNRPQTASNTRCQPTPDPCAYFRTRGGVRVIQALTRLLSSADSEVCVRRWLAELGMLLAPLHSVVVDDNCGDWTRLMRLPGSCATIAASRPTSATPSSTWRTSFETGFALSILAMHETSPVSYDIAVGPLTLLPGLERYAARFDVRGGEITLVHECQEIADEGLGADD